VWYPEREHEVAVMRTARGQIEVVHLKDGSMWVVEPGGIVRILGEFIEVQDSRNRRVVIFPASWVIFFSRAEVSHGQEAV